MTEIVACYVVFNEEDHLAESIRSIKNYVDRFIVIDSVFKSNPIEATHSTDRTRAVAEAVCAAPPAKTCLYIESLEKITEVEARNSYLEFLGSSDWAFVIDGDEILYGDHARILEAFKSIRNGSTRSNLAIPVYTVAIDANKMAPDITSEEFSLNPTLTTSGYMPRLFEARPDLRYTLEKGMVTPALTYAGPPAQYLLEAGRSIPGELFLINHHTRQSLVSYYNDYVWETEGCLLYTYPSPRD